MGTEATWGELCPPGATPLAIPISANDLSRIKMKNVIIFPAMFLDVEY